MWLRLLVPLTLLWPVLALSVEASPLRRYRGTAKSELAALILCIVVYFVLWVVLDRLIEAVSGSIAAGVIASSAVSLLAVPVVLFAAYKLVGVKPDRATDEAH